MNSLLGKKILWVKSKSSQFLCEITNIDSGIRVAELQLTDLETNSIILSILVSKVDRNHPERKVLDQCILIDSPKGSEPTPSSLKAIKKKIVSCMSAEVDAFQIEEYQFTSLKSLINNLNNE